MCREAIRSMKRLISASIIAFLAACRGEPVPPDYQNTPAAGAHPAQSKNETPAQHGGGQAKPEPNTGVSGTAAPTQPIHPTDTATTTIGDTKPVTTTT
jgi:hypothetical protein